MLLLSMVFELDVAIAIGIVIAFIVGVVNSILFQRPVVVVVVAVVQFSK